MPALRFWLLTALPILLLVVGAPARAGAPASTGASAAKTPQAVGSPGATDQRLALAERLSQSGALFYGAWWCPHCQHQKDLFGSKALAFLPYVECDRDEAGRNRCQKAAVRAYPTWVIGSGRREGVLSLAELQSWLDSLSSSGKGPGAAVSPATPGTGAAAPGGRP